MRRKPKPDALDIIRASSLRIEAMLTDYSTEQPSVLAKLLYLQEAELHLGELRPEVKQELVQLREVVAGVCGIVQVQQK